MQQVQSSPYVNAQRRDYFLYVLTSRALVSVCDGLKPAGRRVLWTGRKAGKTKTATLAGATMPIHPHAQPDTVINTLTQPFNNNIPLFDGYGSFGTRLNPIACGAPRYTSVQVADFTHDVIFADMEIIPMQWNYDNTIEEPVHFLPLIPMCLINPSEGIAGGFASNILPRDFSDIVEAQIAHLQDKKKIKNPKVFFKPFNQEGVLIEGNKYLFKGEMTVVNTSTIKVTDLAFGIKHQSFVKHLDKLIDDQVIVDYLDNSKKSIDITIKMERKTLSDMTEEKLRKVIGIDNICNENFTLMDFDNKKVKISSAVPIIQEFTNWRLQYYVARYQRLKDLLEIQIQKYKDIITAIDKNVGGAARTIPSRQALIKHLESIKIVHTDYIADLPVYRFTEEEKKKTAEKMKEANEQIKQYNNLLKSEDERKLVYIDELKSILKKYK